MVQASHAAILLGKQYPTDLEHPRLVVIGATDDELCRVQFRLNAAGIRYFVFQEPDLGDKITAIVTAPVFSDDRKFFRRYRCLGSKNETHERSAGASQNREAS